jgi:hypothetical protein
MLADPPAETRMTKIAPIMSALFPTVREAVEDAYTRKDGVKSLTAAAENALNTCIQNKLDARIHNSVIQGIITNYVYIEMNDKQLFQDWYKRGGLEFYV